MNNLKNLADLFNTKLFRIPDYQRGYAWKEPQLIDLWEDVVNLHIDKFHYTGMISLKYIHESEYDKLDIDDKWLLQDSYKACHIVDGQQRLTTIVVLLNEILKFICNLPENLNKEDKDINFTNSQSINEIRKKYIYIEKLPDKIITTFIFSYEKDNPSAEYLKHKIFEKSSSGTSVETYYTKNLLFAKKFFAERVNELYKDKGIVGLSELYNKLTGKLMFNIHEIKDDYDVYVAFETMNNRGKKLSNLELLKNRLIYLTTLYDKKNLPIDDEVALRNHINETWCEVYYQLGRNENFLLSDDEFLRAHWIIYFSYTRKKGNDYIKFLLNKFSKKSIFEKIITVSVPEPTDYIVDYEEFDDDEDNDIDLEDTSSCKLVLEPIDIENYVKSIKEVAPYWYYSYFPEENKDLTEEEQVWIAKLNRVGISYFRPLVAISMLPKLKISSSDRIRLYKSIERFIFINFRMASYQSSYKSSYYYRKTREVYLEKLSINDVIADLDNTTDDPIKDSIKIFISKMNQRFDSRDGFYSWNDLKYFLYEYEYSLAIKSKIAKLSWAELTKVVKDTITIEHVLPQTPTEQYWQDHFNGFSEKELKVLSGSLGNLVPLSRSINSKLQNNGFEQKKERGYFNGCHSEIEIAKEKIWEASSIYARGLKLLTFMENRWNFQFESDEQKDELLHIAFIKKNEMTM